MEIKLNDVYRFQYNQLMRKKIFEPNWCFDGQLIVKQNSEGQLYLKDTYWGFNDCENKSFTLEQALERGELTFVCNLDDVEKIHNWDLDYYADEDLFDLSYQHKCYENYYKRKGAVKSAEKMERVLKLKIERIKSEIAYMEGDLVCQRKKLDKLQNGDMTIYI